MQRFDLLGPQFFDRTLLTGDEDNALDSFITPHAIGQFDDPFDRSNNECHFFESLVQARRFGDAGGGTDCDQQFTRRPLRRRYIQPLRPNDAVIFTGAQLNLPVTSLRASFAVQSD